MTTSTLQVKLNLEESHNVIQSYFDDINETIENLKDKDRLEQMEVITENFSCFHSFLRLFGDYHYQVNNGGHMQYVDNSYHTTEGNGCFSATTTHDNVHQEMINLMVNFISENETKYCDIALSIMKDMKLSLDTEESYEEICNECNGHGTINNEEEDCTYCDGSGYVEEDNPEYNELDWSTRDLLESLDTRYYDIGDNVIIEIGNLLKSHN